MKILIASGNQHKIEEISSILAGKFPNLEYETLKGKNIPEPDEPYDNFLENSKHKSKYYAQKFFMPTLAEDSGLCVEALGGFPGVKTKRFVEESGSLQEAFNYLQKQLDNQSNYIAKFVCSASIYIPDSDKYICFEGVNNGTLTFPARGEDGFGFDPIFIPGGYTHTLSELGQKVKDQISHRAIAVNGVIEALKVI